MRCQVSNSLIEIVIAIAGRLVLFIMIIWRATVGSDFSAVGVTKSFSVTVYGVCSHRMFVLVVIKANKFIFFD